MKDNNRERQFASAIDFVIVNILFFIIWILIILNEVSSDFLRIIFMTLPFALLFSRDSFTGQSIGKKTFNLIVIDIKANAIVSPWKALIRNLLGLLTPIAFSAVNMNSKRSVDNILNTQVVTDKNHHKSLRCSSFVVFIAVWIILVLLVVVVSLLFPLKN